MFTAALFIKAKTCKQSGWTVTQAVVQPYLRILLNNKMEQSVGLCNNLNKSPENPEGETQVPALLWYVSIYIEHSCDDKIIEIENRPVVAKS